MLSPGSNCLHTLVILLYSELKLSYTQPIIIILINFIVGFIRQLFGRRRRRKARLCVILSADDVVWLFPYYRRLRIASWICVCVRQSSSPPSLPPLCAALPPLSPPVERDCYYFCCCFNFFTISFGGGWCAWSWAWLCEICRMLQHIIRLNFILSFAASFRWLRNLSSVIAYEC